MLPRGGAEGGQQAGREASPELRDPDLGTVPHSFQRTWLGGARGGGGAADGGPGPLDQRAAATHIGVPVPEDLVEHMAELPAEDGAAGQREPDGVGPEGEGPLLVVSAQDDACQVKAKCTRQGPSVGEGSAGAAKQETDRRRGWRATRPLPAPRWPL